PMKASEYRVELFRSQSFNQQERMLVGLFGEELSAVLEHATARHFPDVMASLPRRGISRLLAPARARATLEQVIWRFEGLASETYEGRPVVAACGITGSRGHGAVTTDDPRLPILGVAAAVRLATGGVVEEARSVLGAVHVLPVEA